MGVKYLDAHLDVLASNGRLVIIGFQGVADILEHTRSENIRICRAV